MPLCSVDEAIEEFRAGRFVVIVDDEDRENEGDLAIAAEFADADAINFCVTHGRGLVCTALAPSLIDRFGLPMMVPDAQNTSGFGTPFTVSVEAASGVTTGISAADRARTTSVLIDETATRADLAVPGHSFPLRARENGVLERRGQTEGSVDLAKIAGLKPAAVICEVLNADGTMARMPQLEEFAAEHGLKIVSVDQIAAWRRAREPLARAAE
ncbi:MAG: 3,4-dihydroxy-2-butanone-4-phosphate synthase [Pseudomonadota bacterium]